MRHSQGLRFGLLRLNGLIAIKYCNIDYILMVLQLATLYSCKTIIERGSKFVTTSIYEYMYIITCKF